MVIGELQSENEVDTPATVVYVAWGCTPLYTVTVVVPEMTEDVKS